MNFIRLLLVASILLLGWFGYGLWEARDFFSTDKEVVEEQVLQQSTGLSANLAQPVFKIEGNKPVNVENAVEDIRLKIADLGDDLTNDEQRQELKQALADESLRAELLKNAKSQMNELVTNEQ